MTTMNNAVTIMNNIGNDNNHVAEPTKPRGRPKTGKALSNAERKRIFDAKKRGDTLQKTHKQPKSSTKNDFDFIGFYVGYMDFLLSNSMNGKYLGAVYFDDRFRQKLRDVGFDVPNRN